MMQYSLFIGCQIPARVQAYETAARAVLEELGADLTDIRQFNCCGYPMRNTDKKAYLLSAVRNLALTEKAGLDMLVLCHCCFGALKNAESIMREKGQLQDEVREKLRDHGLEYRGSARIRHYLSVLGRDIGAENLKKHLRQTFSGLSVAVQHGCHLLRPSSVTGFDDPVNPSIFDSLVAATGAASLDWKDRLECCGAPLTGINDDLSVDLGAKKLESAKKAGADFLCTSCPYCQIQFEHVSDAQARENRQQPAVPSVVFLQLLGFSMGIEPRKLGFDAAKDDITVLESYLSKE